MTEARAAAAPRRVRRPTEAAVRVTDRAIQIYGGYGFTKDFPVEKYYRDVRLCTVGEGTSEIQKLVIARQLLGKA